MMTWQLLCFLISVFGLYQAFHKIDKDNFEEYKIKFGRYRKRVLFIFGLAALSSIVIDIYDYNQNSKKDIKVAHSQEIIDSLNGASKELKLQLSESKSEIKSNTESCAKTTYEQIHETEGKMVVDFANHTKDIIRNANHNSDILRDSLASMNKKFSQKSLKPAHMCFANTPTDCRFIFTGDTLKVQFDFHNDGDLVAYNANFEVHTLITTSGANFELIRGGTKLFPSDYSSNTQVTSTTIYHFDSSAILAQNDAISVIAKGYFYSNQNLSPESKQYFSMGRTKIIGRALQQYSYQVSMDSLIKGSIPLDADFK